MATTAIVGEKVGMSQKWVDDRIVPVTVLRVAFVVSIILPGPQFLAYVALWILMPSEGS